MLEEQLIAGVEDVDDSVDYDLEVRLRDDGEWLRARFQDVAGGEALTLVEFAEIAPDGDHVESRDPYPIPQVLRDTHYRTFNRPIQEPGPDVE